MLQCRVPRGIPAVRSREVPPVPPARAFRYEVLLDPRQLRDRGVDTVRSHDEIRVESRRARGTARDHAGHALSRVDEVDDVVSIEEPCPGFFGRILQPRIESRAPHTVARATWKRA